MHSLRNLYGLNENCKLRYSKQYLDHLLYFRKTGTVRASENLIYDKNPHHHHPNFLNYFITKSPCQLLSFSIDNRIKLLVGLMDSKHGGKMANDCQQH